MFVVVALLPAPQSSAQALTQARLAGGVEVLVVNLPMADAVTACWPQGGPAGDTRVGCCTGGGLTAISDIEAALRTASDLPIPEPAPPVVVVVGGGPVAELLAAVERAVDDRPLAPTEAPSPEPFREGIVERRLGPAGSEATLRLSIPLPSAADPRRTSVEALWELLPALLRSEAPQLLARVDGDRGVLESLHEADSWELALERLRTGLARLASETDLDPAAVAAAAGRIAVRRVASLEDHPGGARKLLELYLSAGGGAVREYLFGTSGVSRGSVRQAASAWLPQHPGVAEVTLPPRVLNPRFAPGPEVVRLGNDLTAAILERPSTPLAVVVVRPAVLPDLDGQLTATVLARLAGELRRHSDPPGSIRVVEQPPALELAAEADNLPGIAEALRVALANVATDDRDVTGDSSDARRRALAVTASQLGLEELVAPNPADLLRPSNLALGVVARDGEAALETLGKLLVTRGGSARPATASIATDSRTRVAVAGTRSTVVALLPLDAALSEGAALVLEEILRERAAAVLVGADTEILRPYVPGRPTLLVVTSAEGRLDELERRLSKAWPQLTRDPSESEVDRHRRQVASQRAAVTSGALGRGRRAAEVALGVVDWRAPADLELEILTTPAEALSTQLETLRRLEGLATCGAGVLPIPRSSAGSAAD